MRRLKMLVSIVTFTLLACETGRGQTPTTDMHGDPLPSGAIARLGTTRLRHDTPIVFAAFLPGDKSVLSASRDGVVCAWEFPSGKLIRRLEAHGAAERPVGFNITGATLSPDGKHLTAFGGDGFLYLWEWAGGKLSGKLANVRTPSDGYYSEASLPVYSRDGKTLLLATRVMQMVDLTTGKEIGPGVGHADSLTSLAFMPGGQHIVTKDLRHSHVWDAQSGKRVGNQKQKRLDQKLIAEAGSPPVISPDGRFAVIVARVNTEAVLQAAAAGGPLPGREATMFEVETGKELCKLEQDPEAVVNYRKPMVFSPDSKLLAVVRGNAQQKIEIHEVPSGKKLRSLDGGPGQPAGKFGKGFGGGFPGGGGGFAGFMAARLNTGQRLLFSADSTTLAFQAGPGAAILVLDTTTGKQIASLAAQGNLTLQGAFTPDGGCLALEKGDGTTTFFELATGQPRRTYGHPRPGERKSDDPDFGFSSRYGEPIPQDRVRGSIAISPDGKLLALPGLAGVVQLWDVLTGAEVSILKGHASLVTAMAFGPGGKTLASASQDTTALVWDVSRIARPNAVAKAPKAGDLEAWWDALADVDAGKAFAAMGDLVASPKEAVAFLKERVLPAAPVDPKRTQELLEQLDSENFQIRDKATRELLKMGELLVPELEKALGANTSAEKHRRLQELHAKLTGTTLQGERLRSLRAVEALEWMGTPEARQLLQSLGGGAPGALITARAKSALAR